MGKLQRIIEYDDPFYKIVLLFIFIFILKVIDDWLREQFGYWQGFVILIIGVIIIILLLKFIRDKISKTP